jgi:transglutaminase superfamily protein
MILLRQARGRRPAETFLMVRIWTFVSVLPALLAICSVTRLLRFCDLAAPRPPEDPSLIVACVGSVFARHPGASRSLCLKRSLTLYRFLGGPASGLQVCFGVRYAAAEPPPGRRGRQLEGHAWLIRSGAPYLETGDPDLRRFRVIFVHPSRKSRVA